MFYPGEKVLVSKNGYFYSGEFNKLQYDNDDMPFGECITIPNHQTFTILKFRKFENKYDENLIWYELTIKNKRFGVCRFYIPKTEHKHIKKSWIKKIKKISREEYLKSTEF